MAFETYKLQYLCDYPSKKTFKILVRDKQKFQRQWILNGTDVFIKLTRATYVSVEEKNIKFRVFLDVAPRSHVEVVWCFRGAYCLHQGDDRPDDGGATATRSGAGYCKECVTQ
jgi:hypothetical protein